MKNRLFHSAFMPGHIGRLLFCQGWGVKGHSPPHSGGASKQASVTSFCQYFKGKKKLHIGKEKTERRLVKKIDFISFIL
jgi:hypothetical protein